MNPELAKKILTKFLRYYHPETTYDDLEIASSRGYWHKKQKCPGGKNCTHAFRMAIGPCSGNIVLSIYFSEAGLRDQSGRFISPYRVWRCLYKNKNQRIALL